MNKKTDGNKSLAVRTDEKEKTDYWQKYKRIRIIERKPSNLLLKNQKKLNENETEKMAEGAQFAEAETITEMNT